MKPHQNPNPDFHRAHRLATALLAGVASLWVMLLLAVHFLHLSHSVEVVLGSAFEAGVVGGLADWYAITVIFRNPFGRFPLPAILRDHTAIIPRNKDHIALALGRFVQENFLAPERVHETLQKFDVTLHVAQMMRDEAQLGRLSDELQRIAVSTLEAFESDAIEAFIRDSVVEGLQHTDIHRMLSSWLFAIASNDTHHDALQYTIESIDLWAQTHRPQAEELIASTLRKSSVLSTLVHVGKMMGIHVEARVAEAILNALRDIHDDPEHPLRKQIDATLEQTRVALQQDDSWESRWLNQTKDRLSSSAVLIDFSMRAITNLRQMLKHDLQSSDSWVAAQGRKLAQQMAQRLIEQQAVREAINLQIERALTYASGHYAGSIIDYIRDTMLAWDTGEMTRKMEMEVGSDLHMIRVNGVLVGSLIGFCLGLSRWLVGG